MLLPFAVREATVGLDGLDRRGWGRAVWLRADDADALCAELRAIGVKITQKPDDRPFGRTFTFVDPGGYRRMPQAAAMKRRIAERLGRGVDVHGGVVECA